MNTENDIALVERYFDKDLSEAEEQQLMERLNTDRAFQTLFEQEKALIQNIRLGGFQRDLATLKRLEQTISRSSGEAGAATPTRSLFPWVYAAAAAVVFFLLLWWLAPAPHDTDELFAAYFQPYPNIFEATVRGDEPGDERALAFQAYESQNYPEALQRFTALLEEKQEPGTLMLLGNTNLMLGNFEEARGNFIELITNFDELDLQAKWYLSLCYLKEGDLDKAREVLRELGQTEVSYADKAKRLLDDVK